MNERKHALSTAVIALWSSVLNRGIPILISRPLVYSLFKFKWMSLRQKFFALQIGSN